MLRFSLSASELKRILSRSSFKKIFSLWNIMLLFQKCIPESYFRDSAKLLLSAASDYNYQAYLTMD